MRLMKSTSGGDRRASVGGVRRLLLLVGGIVPLLALAQAPISDASFVATTANTSAASTMVIDPPSNVEADLALVVIPPSCRAFVSWDASETPGVTSYEVVRVNSSTGAVLEGPWTVTGTSTTDSALPLALLAPTWEWRVRSLHLGWHSAWSAGIPSEFVACLL